MTINKNGKSRLSFSKPLMRLMRPPKGLMSDLAKPYGELSKSKSKSKDLIYPITSDFCDYCDFCEISKGPKGPKASENKSKNMHLVIYKSNKQLILYKPQKEIETKDLEAQKTKFIVRGIVFNIFPDYLSIEDSIDSYQNTYESIEKIIKDLHRIESKGFLNHTDLTEFLIVSEFIKYFSEDPDYVKANGVETYK